MLLENITGLTTFRKNPNFTTYPLNYSATKLLTSSHQFPKKNKKAHKNVGVKKPPEGGLVIP